jgi:hypothetical protein
MFGAIRLIHTKIVLVFIGISMFQAESSKDDTEGMLERKTKVLMGKKFIFDHCAIFCMFLYAACMWLTSEQ